MIRMMTPTLAMLLLLTAISASPMRDDSDDKRLAGANYHAGTGTRLNSVSSISHSTTTVVAVIRQEAPVTQTRRVATKRAVRKAGSVGGSRMMECDIVYPGGRYMERIITWRKHGIEVPVFVQFNGYPPHVDQSYMGRVRLVEQASIEISDLRPRDQGWYECSVVFLDGSTEESSGNGTWIYLSVNAPPVVRDSIYANEDHPSIGDLFVRRQGESISINCDVIAGTPSPTITWVKDGTDVMTAAAAVWRESGDEDRFSAEGTVLTITGLRPSDGGLFRCIAKNVVGQDEQVFRLVIEGHVYVMSGPKNMTSFEGTQASLSCHADGYPGNVTHRWFHYQQSVAEEPDVGDGDHINFIDDDVSGTEDVSETTKLVPRLVTSVEQSLELPGTRSRYVVRNDGTLVIHNLTSSDAGWYSCRPVLDITSSAPPSAIENQRVMTSPEARAYLNVTYLPRVVASPAQLYLAVGLPGRLHCRVDANPPVIRVIWTRNERPIPDLGQIVPPFHNRYASTTTTSSAALTPQRMRTNDRGSLLFRLVEKDDEGRYACAGVSAAGVGSSSRSMQVFVREPPYFTTRPEAVYQRQVAQSVTFPCAAEADPWPSFAWRKVGGTLAESRTALNSGNLTIFELKPTDQGLYECIATNAVASSVTSTLLIIEARNVRSPSNVTVVTASHSATVTWAPAYNGGYVQHYVIWFRDTSYSSSTWRTVQAPVGGTNSVTVYELRPSTPYSFVVFARTQPSLGENNEMFSAVVNATTHGDDSSMGSSAAETVTLSPLPTFYGVNHWASSRDPFNSMYSQAVRLAGPVNVSVERLANGSLQVNWSPNLANTRYKLVRHYTLQYRTVGRWVPLVAWVPADQTSFVWTTASRGVIYHFRVIGHYGPEETSDPSAAVSIYTGEIIEVDVLNFNEQAIELALIATVKLRQKMYSWGIFSSKSSTTVPVTNKQVKDRSNEVTQTANKLMLVAVCVILLCLLCLIFSFVFCRVMRRQRRRKEAITRATTRYMTSTAVTTTQLSTPVTDRLQSVDAQTTNVIAVNHLPIIEIINVHETPI